MLPWVRRSRNSVLFATQICTLQAGTVLFPTLFEAFLLVVFKYRRVGVVPEKTGSRHLNLLGLFPSRNSGDYLVADSQSRK